MGKKNGKETGVGVWITELEKLDKTVASSNLKEMKEIGKRLSIVLADITAGIVAFEDAEKLRLEAEKEKLRIKEEKLLAELNELREQQKQIGFGSDSKKIEQALKVEQTPKVEETPKAKVQTPKAKVEQTPKAKVEETPKVERQYKEVCIAWRDITNTVFEVNLGKSTTGTYAKNSAELRLLSRSVMELLGEICCEEAVQEVLAVFEHNLSGIQDRARNATWAVVQVAYIVKLWRLFEHVVGECANSRMRRLSYLTRRLVDGGYDSVNPSEDMTRRALNGEI